MPIVDIKPKKPSYPSITELGGRIQDLCRYVDKDDLTWGATNASIAVDDDGNYSISLRSSNYVITPKGAYTVINSEKGIKSNFWFSDLDKDFNIIKLRKIDTSKVGIKIERGLEDPKLLWDKDHWKFSAVMMEPHTYPARMVVGHLDKKATKIVSLQKFPGVDVMRPEKNWMMPSQPNPNFDFIYGPNVTVKNNIMTTKLSDCPELSLLRGNTNLHHLGNETYIAVVHRLWQDQRSIYKLRDYAHHFALYNSQGVITHLSNGFTFYGGGVEFAAGITEHKDEFVISYGSKDVSSHLAFISKKTVLKSLRPVAY